MASTSSHPHPSSSSITTAEKFDFHYPTHSHGDTERLASLQEQITSLRGQLLSQRTSLLQAEDELASHKRKWEMEKIELESALRREERKVREGEEDLRLLRNNVSNLKDENYGLSAEVGRVKLLVGEREAEVECLKGRVGELVRQREAELAGWEDERRAWDEERREWDAEREKMRGEIVRGEEERRALMAMVLDLKGGIRVFCRVRWAFLFFLLSFC